MESPTKPPSSWSANHTLKMHTHVLKADEGGQKIQITTDSSDRISDRANVDLTYLPAHKTSKRIASHLVVAMKAHQPEVWTSCAAWNSERNFRCARYARRVVNPLMVAPEENIHPTVDIRQKIFRRNTYAESQDPTILHTKIMKNATFCHRFDAFDFPGRGEVVSSDENHDDSQRHSGNKDPRIDDTSDHNVTQTTH